MKIRDISKDFYITGTSFLLGAAVIDNHRYEGELVYAATFPVMVNLAFSIESFLKALHCYSANITPFKTHNLFDIFVKLPTNYKKDIVDNYLRYKTNTVDKKNIPNCMDDFLALLNKHKNAFESWRYAELHDSSNDGIFLYVLSYVLYKYSQKALKITDKYTKEIQVEVEKHPIFRSK